METHISDRFSVVYGIQADSYEEAKHIAFSIQVEQTIEFPYEFLKTEWIKSEIVGQLEFLEKRDTMYFAGISYGSELAGNEVTQFLNVVFGNSSLQPGIWVEDIILSPSLYTLFKGPRFGLDGLRKQLQVPKRPLLQAVIKPIGKSASELAEMCYAYSAGGVDVIKDDHGITNQVFAPFEERVARCVEAVRKGRAVNGSKTLYAANVSGDGAQTFERAYRAKELGADAIMVAPGLIGFGAMHRLATDESFGLPIISHPAFSGGPTMPGVSGISMPVWFGILNRLCGADMSIFVSYGGRFSGSKELCQTIIKRLLEPKGDIKASCPAPGGGITATRLPELMQVYGPDVMYLVGGDMFRRGLDLAENTKYFLHILEAQA